MQQDAHGEAFTARRLFEEVVLETARGRRNPDVYVVDRSLGVACSNTGQSQLPAWSIPPVRAAIERGEPIPNIENERVVGVRPISPERELYVVVVEARRQRIRP